MSKTHKKAHRSHSAISGLTSRATAQPLGHRTKYKYDALGQVIFGKKYWSDQGPVAGQQFEYTFDDIGNRTQTRAGGDASGANERPANYYANILNQYTNRDVPGYVDVMGLAYATNPVTVNGTTAYRHGEYFRQELAVNNTTTSVWQSVTVQAPGQTGVTGNKYIPKTPEVFSYDYDGNLTNDGRWAYTWDAENRLVAMAANTANGPQQSLRFEYDSKGRRVHKQVWGNTNCFGNATNDLKFVYDGWNLMADLTSANLPVRTYLWGLDLSGSPQGAGGVGGLLEMVYYGPSTTNCFVAFDANGNAAGLVNAADGTLAAEYGYSPFGDLLRATGLMAWANKLRFSSKPQDDETELMYHGFRYYNANTARWLSADPILSESPGVEEATDEYGYDDEPMGGQTAYANNNPVSHFDPIGLWPSTSPFLSIILGGTPLTHQNANRNALPISGGMLFVLNYTTVAMDKGPHVQEPANSFRHAMRDGTINETDAHARARANKDVKDRLSKAEDLLCRCRDAQAYLEALELFGEALHTVQDSTSPAHNKKHGQPGKHEFKPWYGEWDLPNVVAHVMKENFDPSSRSGALWNATHDMLQYFQCKTTAPALPPDFFHYGVDTRHSTFP